MDNIVDAIDEFIGVAILFWYTVDTARDGQIVWIRYKTFMHDGWPKWTKRVHRFANQKLPTILLLLPISSWNILRNSIAKDMVHGICFANMSSFFANDNGQLNLPIQLL